MSLLEIFSFLAVQFWDIESYLESPLIPTYLHFSSCLQGDLMCVATLFSHLRTMSTKLILLMEFRSNLGL